MKHLVLSFGVCLLSWTAQAGVPIKKVVANRTVTLPIEISYKTVKMSRAGYVEDTLKVLVPALADITVMDHRNQGEGAPCLGHSVFPLGDGANVESVVDGRPGIENVEFKIELKRESVVDEQNICTSVLVETIHANIRGTNFGHVRTAPLPDRVAEDCK